MNALQLIAAAVEPAPTRNKLETRKRNLALWEQVVVALRHKPAVATVHGTKLILTPLGTTDMAFMYVNDTEELKNIVAMYTINNPVHGFDGDSICVDPSTSRDYESLAIPENPTPASVLRVIFADAAKKLKHRAVAAAEPPRAADTRAIKMFQGIRTELMKRKRITVTHPRINNPIEIGLAKPSFMSGSLDQIGMIRLRTRIGVRDVRATVSGDETTPTELYFQVKGRKCKYLDEVHIDTTSTSTFLQSIVNWLVLEMLGPGNTAEAATEPEATTGVVACFRKLLRQLPQTDPDKLLREHKAMRIQGLDVVVLTHESDATIRFHILDGGSNYCGFAEVPYAPNKNPRVRLELQGVHGNVVKDIEYARDTKNLLQQMLRWFVYTHKVNQTQRQNFSFKDHK